MNEELLTCDELAAKLKVRPSTVRSWTHRRVIPAERVGRTVRYRLSDVLEAGKEPDDVKPKRKLKVNRPPT